MATSIDDSYFKINGYGYGYGYCMGMARYGHMINIMDMSVNGHDGYDG